MISLLLVSIWPMELSRELITEATVVMGLKVQSWAVQEPYQRVKRHLVNLDCMALPAVKSDHWQCLTKDTIYSWDYSAQPSIWSESRQFGTHFDPETIRWGGVELTVQTRREALYLVYREVMAEAQLPGSSIYLTQQYQGAFVCAWKRAGYDYVVSVWRHEDGNVFVTRLDRKDVP